MAEVNGKIRRAALKEGVMETRKHLNRFCGIITVLDNGVSQIPSLLAISPTFDLLLNEI